MLACLLCTLAFSISIDSCIIHTILNRASLDKLIAQQFPLKSTEFVPGSPQYNEYISVIDKVQNILEDIACSHY